MRAGSIAKNMKQLCGSDQCWSVPFMISLIAPAGRPGIDRKIELFSQSDPRPCGLGFLESFTRIAIEEA
jgi:hypothetical protein